VVDFFGLGEKGGEKKSTQCGVGSAQLCSPEKKGTRIARGTPVVRRPWSGAPFLGKKKGGPLDNGLGGGGGEGTLSWRATFPRGGEKGELRFQPTDHQKGNKCSSSETAFLTVGKKEGRGVLGWGSTGGGKAASMGGVGGGGEKKPRRTGPLKKRRQSDMTVFLEKKGGGGPETPATKRGKKKEKG